MTASAYDKFLLLLWKNTIISQVRHPVQTIFEVLIPVIVCALVVLLRVLVDVESFTEDVKYKSTTTNVIGEHLFNMGGVNRNLAFSPDNPVLKSLIQNVANEYDFTVTPIESAKLLGRNFCDWS